MGLRPDFWAGKRVLVTGHTGFKGSWLVLWLQRLGAHVAGFALAPATSPSLFSAASLDQGITSIIGDIRDLDQLTEVVDRWAPEVVMHLAAQSLVRESYLDPVATYATNVMGTVNLLEAVRGSESVRACVNVTSDKCYVNKEWHWGYREIDPLGGHDPYSSSKACSELVTAAYRASFFGPDRRTLLATARAGNVIGGGDWGKDRLVPDVIQSLSAGQAPLIRNPAAVRPWQHVLDPLCGYLMLAERLYAGEAAVADAWNFGPADASSKSVAWLVDRMVKQWGGDTVWRRDTTSQPHEAHLLQLDSGKARAQLGWRQRLPLAEAVDWTVRWYKGFSAGEDARALCENQIDEFSQRMGSAL